jgi:RNA polymerase sigma-70 factor, ECF subfamily
MNIHNLEKRIESLFNENFQALVFSSFRIVKDYEQSEDIVQNVFVKLWQNYEKVKHIADLKPYVYKAVRNSSLNFIRDKKVIEERLLEANRFNADTVNQFEENAPEGFDSSKVHEAVDRIPEKWREAFILSKYEHLKYSEIAKKMAISEKTVEKYMSKALNFLRIELKDLLTIILLLFFIRKL